MKTEQCENCKFYAIADEHQGLCRRYPPAIPGTAPAPRPMVSKLDWCGEWRDRSVSISING